MKTRFDNIADEEIRKFIEENEITGTEPPSAYEILESDLSKIAFLSVFMKRWRHWIGPPCVLYDGDAQEMDGHHRVRSCKYLARVEMVEIAMPVRYYAEHLIAEEKQKAIQHDKDYRAPCSDDCVCCDKSCDSK